MIGWIQCVAYIYCMPTWPSGWPSFRWCRCPQIPCSLLPTGHRSHQFSWRYAILYAELKPSLCPQTTADECGPTWPHERLGLGNPAKMELRGEEGGTVSVFRLHKWVEHLHQDSLGFGWGADETHCQIPVIEELKESFCFFEYGGYISHTKMDSFTSVRMYLNIKEF